MAVGTGVADGTGVNESTKACTVASTPMGVTDGAGVNESTKARTVASTSTGVAVGIGSSICGVTVGTDVSVGTGVKAETMAWTVARTSTGVGVTGGGCTQAVTASDVTSAATDTISVLMIQDIVARSVRGVHTLRSPRIANSGYQTNAAVAHVLRINRFNRWRVLRRP